MSIISNICSTNDLFKIEETPMNDFIFNPNKKLTQNPKSLIGLPLDL